MDSNMVNIHGTIGGNVIVGGNIANSFNTLASEATGDALNDLFDKLIAEIHKLDAKVVPAQLGAVKVIQRDAQDLLAERTLARPRTSRYQISLQDIKDAAITLGEHAQPVLALAEKITDFLLKHKN